MDIEIRLKVTADLCCDCVRNSAYYDAGWHSPTILKKDNSDFWVNLNGNFLDIAVLSWCCLFGDGKAEFRWQKIIEDQEKFCSSLYVYMQCPENEFEVYAKNMRGYRDKLVAHRDRYLNTDPKIHYPDLRLAIKSTTFLFSELVRIYPQMGEINIHKDLDSFYKSRLKHALGEYDKALSNSEVIVQ